MFSKIAAVLAASELLATGEALRREFEPRTSSFKSSVGTLAALMQEHMEEDLSADVISQAMGKLKSLESQDATPGVAGGLSNTVGKLIEEIQASVDPKIKQAHESDQQSIDAMIKDLQQATDDLVEDKSSADAADAEWNACMVLEKQDLATWEQEQGNLKSARSSQIAPCQQEEDSEPFAWEAAQSTFDFTCDISKAGSCDAEIQALEALVKSMQGKVEGKLETATSTHASWTRKCTTAKDTVAAQEQTLSAAESTFLTQQAACGSSDEGRQLKMCEFNSQYASKCRKAKNFNSEVKEIKNVSEVVRMRESKTSKITQCMLKAVQQQETLSKDTLAACEAEVNYGQAVGTLEMRSVTFDALMSAEKFTCAETRVAFAGTSWQVQGAQGDAKSTDYKKIKNVEFSLPLAACQVAPKEDVLFSESFEVPETVKEVSVCSYCKPVLKGWTNPGHPSSMKVANEGSFKWSTPYGNQALAVFGYQRGPNKTDSGAEAYLQDVLRAGMEYHLTFNAASSGGAQYGDYKVELCVADAKGKVQTTLASTAGKAMKLDMSDAGEVIYRTTAASPVGQKLVIRLLDDDVGDHRNTPVYDNVKLVLV